MARKNDEVDSHPKSKLDEPIHNREAVSAASGTAFPESKDHETSVSVENEKVSPKETNDQNHQVNGSELHKKEVSKKKFDVDKKTDVNKKTKEKSTVFLSTSFETFDAKPFDKLELGLAELVSDGGTNSINKSFAKSGSQCLRMHGDNGNKLTFKFRENVDLRGLTFHAERWSSRKPFLFSIEVELNGKWWSIAKLDNVIQVGKRFRTFVAIPLPKGPLSGVRFISRAAANGGVLIDDLVFMLKPPAKPTYQPTINSFENIARSFELPAIDDLSPRKVCDILKNERSLMGAKLFVAPIPRQRSVFTMKRSPDNKRLWIVSLGSSSGETKIAKFWQTDSELRFQWLEAAQKFTHANYLRNGALRLEMEQVAWVNLRKPIIIDEFSVADKKSIDAAFSIPWLPQRKQLQVQVLPIAKVKSHCEPDLITKNPARIFFTADTKKMFLWLEVKTSSGPLRRLEAALKINLEGRIRSARMTELVEYQKRLSAVIDGMQRQLSVLGKNDNRRKQIASAIKTTSAVRSTLAEYQKNLASLEGKSIPVAIYIEFREHRLLIAKTPGVEKFRTNVVTLGGKKLD